MRGRRPKATRLKVLAGNPGKRPLNGEEPQPKRSIPRCPDHLDADAKKEWKRLTKELDEVGLLSDMDRAALAAYCVVYARWVRAERKVASLGAVLETADGNLYQNPHLAVANQALDQMHRLGPLFGLDPSSRSRMHVQLPKKPSAFDKFLNG